MEHLERAPAADVSLPENAHALSRMIGQDDIDQHARVDAHRKLLATLQARTALWGGSLPATESDRGTPVFIVTRWALTRAFDSLGEVEDWLQRVGVPG